MFVFVRDFFLLHEQTIKKEMCINMSKNKVVKLNIVLQIRGLIKVLNLGVN